MLKFHLTASLTDHSRKPRAQTKYVVHSHHFTLQQKTHRWDVPFGVLTSVHPVRPFILNQVSCLLLESLKPYRGVTLCINTYESVERL